jgi:nitrate/TMAO reductase-like tetraheme cytochrome c subunit
MKKKEYNQIARAGQEPCKYCHSINTMRIVKAPENFIELGYKKREMERAGKYYCNSCSKTFFVVMSS